jgi:hypothetical protein
MAAIIVIGKGDLGYSPKFGAIIQGQEYTIEEEDFAPELFERKRKKEPKGGDN